MKKSELKTGMIVITKDNVCRVVLSDTLVSYNDGGVCLKWLDEGLNGRNHKDHAIEKVYSSPQNQELCADMKFWFEDQEILQYCNLLWARKPEKVIEFDGVEYSESTLRSIIKKATE